MNTTPEQREVMVKVTLETLVKNFPIIGPFFEVLIEYTSEVKQRRINHFIGLLQDAFIKHSIDINALQTEENVDLFEAIFKKVAITRSETKRIALKNILVYGIERNEEIDFCETFSELLMGMRDVQIEILKRHKRFLLNGQGVLTVRNDLKNELQLAEQREMGQPASCESLIP